MKTDLARRDFLSLALKTLGVSFIPNLQAQNKPTAKNVIYLYMAGGMSHLDTFDPKPGTEESGGVKAIKTKVDNVFVSEYFPLLAREFDKIRVINSLSTTQGAHEQGNYFMHSSYTMRGTITHPGLGAWIEKLSGKTNKTLPASVLIGGGANGNGAGWMESKYNPLHLENPFAGIPNSKPQVGTGKFQDRIDLANKLNADFHGKYDNKKVRAYNSVYDDAIKLMKSEDLKAFDLSQESPQMREFYGNNNFGQGCLLARRLVENDVRYVEVTLGGWDTHNDNFTAVANLAAVLDQALSSLLVDLAGLGLLEETLVVLATEFGRTPEINLTDGRDHFPQAFSGLICGGGVKPGKYGLTNENGSKVIDGKIGVPDFNATIAYALGLPLDQIIYSDSKRPFQVADKGKSILEIF